MKKITLTLFVVMFYSAAPAMAKINPNPGSFESGQYLQKSSEDYKVNLEEILNAPYSKVAYVLKDLEGNTSVKVLNSHYKALKITSQDLTFGDVLKSARASATEDSPLEVADVGTVVICIVAGVASLNFLDLTYIGGREVGAAIQRRRTAAELSKLAPTNPSCPRKLSTLHEQITKDSPTRLTRVFGDSGTPTVN